MKVSKEARRSERKLREYLQTLDKDRLINLFLQIQWEHDIAFEQLEELGYGFGEAIKPEDKKTEDIEKFNYTFDVDDEGNINIKDAEKIYISER